MTSMEALRINRLLRVSGNWSQGAEARTARGVPVNYNDLRAAAWSLDGVIYRVMGPARAMQQMVGFAMHMLAVGGMIFNRADDPPFAALRALKDYNDLQATYPTIRRRLLDLPVDKE